MDEIRQNILREQEKQKAKFASHFGQAFSANGTVNEDGRDVETTATKSADEVHKENKRQSVIKAIEIEGVDDALDILKSAGDEDIFEKAKHQDGDVHPNGKWVWVSSAAGGKGDWRTMGGRAHKKSGGNTSTASSTNSSPQTTPNSKVTAKNKKGDGYQEKQIGNSNNKSSLNISSIDSLNNDLSEYEFQETGKSKNRRKQGIREVNLNGAWDKDGNHYELTYYTDKNDNPNESITAILKKFPKGRYDDKYAKSETIPLSKLGDRLNEIFSDTVEHNKGKLINKLDFKTGNYFSDQGGIKAQDILSDLFPELKKSNWTKTDIEGAGFDFSEMAKFVSAIRNVGHAMYSNTIISNKQIDNLIPYEDIVDMNDSEPEDNPDYIKTFKDTMKQYNDTLADAVNKSEGDIENLLKDATNKVKTNQNAYDNIKSSGMTSRLPLAAKQLAKARAKQLALENVKKGKKEAMFELHKINLNNYKFKK